MTGRIKYSPEDLPTYGFAGEVEQDSVACLLSVVMGPLTATTVTGDDGSTIYRLTQNGNIVGLRDIHPALYGAVCPELKTTLDELERLGDRDTLEYQILADDFRRARDVRELGNIYRALWFEVDYWNRVERGELPNSNKWE